MESSGTGDEQTASGRTEDNGANRWKGNEQTARGRTEDNGTNRWQGGEQKTTERTEARGPTEDKGTNRRQGDEQKTRERTDGKGANRRQRNEQTARGRMGWGLRRQNRVRLRKMPHRGTALRRRCQCGCHGWSDGQGNGQCCFQLSVDRRWAL